MKTITCTKCKIASFRNKIVIGRGSIPADILFIGEAPGKSENATGKPFIGRAGKLLDSMILDACNLSGSREHKYYITNTVLCRPTDSFSGDNRPPTGEEVLNCKKNLDTIISSVKPKIVIFIGKIAKEYYGKEFPLGIAIQHPAFILRQGGKSSSWYLTNVRILAEVFQNANRR